MRLALAAFVLLASCAVAPAQRLPSNSWTGPIDTQASVLRWTGHAEVGTYAPSGTLRFRDGSLRFERGVLQAAVLKVNMQSLQQENADLAHHLKSADFFDVERYPIAQIRIDRATNGKAFGSLTIRGKQTPLEVPVTVVQMSDRYKITGKVTLDRTRYGITYNSKNFFSGLGDKAIRNDFDVEFEIVGVGTIPQAYR